MKRWRRDNSCSSHDDAVQRNTGALRLRGLVSCVKTSERRANETPYRNCEYSPAPHHTHTTLPPPSHDNKNTHSDLTSTFYLTLHTHTSSAHLRRRQRVWWKPNARKEEGGHCLRSSNTGVCVCVLSYSVGQREVSGLPLSRWGEGFVERFNRKHFIIYSSD